MFTATRRECIPAGSVAGSLLLSVSLHVCLLHRAFPYGPGCSGVEHVYGLKSAPTEFS